MNIRHARIEDAAEASLVIRRSIVELCSLDHGGDERSLAEWLSNKTAENVGRWILESRFLVAEEAERILGLAAMTESGKITLNYVSPDARFRGVSKQLMLRLESDARALGLEECQLETTQTALRFYKKLGYAVSTLPRAGMPATVLTKRLVPPKT